MIRLPVTKRPSHVTKIQLLVAMVLWMILLTEGGSRNTYHEGQCWDMNCTHNNITKFCNRPNRKCEIRGASVACVVSAGDWPPPEKICTNSFFSNCVCDINDDQTAQCACHMPGGAKASIALLCLFCVSVLVLLLAFLKWLRSKKLKMEEHIKKQEICSVSDGQKMVSNDGRQLHVIEERSGEVRGRISVDSSGRPSHIRSPGLAVAGRRPGPRVSVGMPAHPGRPSRVSADHRTGPSGRPSHASAGGVGFQTRPQRISTGSAGSRGHTPRVSTSSVESQGRTCSQ